MIGVVAPLLGAEPVRREVDVSGVRREYYIHIPRSVAGKPAPLVFALHGGASNSGLQMHRKTDFTLLGEKEGYVTVYPSGLSGWNTGDPGNSSDADDLGFFRVMIDTFIDEGLADPHRIYVVGGSNGGVMVQRLVSEMADRIAAAGVVVATLEDWLVASFRASRPVSIMFMLGTEDPFKPWEGKPGMLSAEATVDFWVHHDGCVDDPDFVALPDTDPTDGTWVYDKTWTRCHCGTSVRFYKMEGHGHGWPNQEYSPLTGSKTRDISAPDELWRFLRQFRLGCRVGVRHVNRRVSPG